MPLRKLSLTAAGCISAILILVPGAAALMFSSQALEQVRTVEKREPAALTSLMTESMDWGDPAAWNAVAAALSDRIPSRVHLTRMLHGIERDRFGRRLFDKVVACPGPWMYYTRALDRAPTTVEQMDRALATLRALSNAEPDRFYLAPPPDKVSIYPEPLCTHRWIYEAKLSEREALQNYFATSSSPALIDTWSPLRAEKIRSSRPLYFRTDTHHNNAGALIYARTLIDSIAPGSWGDAAITFGAPVSSRRDLVELAGLPGPTEADIPFTMQRPGVRADACYAFGEEIDCADIFSPPRYRIRVRAVSSERLPLIPGRTLIIHDSFVHGFLKPVLWQYFEDLSYIVFDDIELDELAASFATYDRIIISRVERYLRRMIDGIGRLPADGLVTTRQPGLDPDG
jgi:hypothetical protein